MMTELSFLGGQHGRCAKSRGACFAASLLPTFRNVANSRSRYSRIRRGQVICRSRAADKNPKQQLESGKPAVYEDAYVAGMGISELGMTVYPTGVFYVLALPLQVDQFQRIDGVFRCRLMSSVLLQSSDSGERLNPPPRSPLSLCSSLWLCLEIGSFNRIILGADCKQSYDSSLGQNQVAPITLFVFYFSLFRISRSFLCHRFRSVCLWLL